MEPASPAPASRWPPASHLWVLAACALGVIAHQYVRLEWFIDDAAIVFAYARNIADGHGIVPWPGGERIEAYSDPTWLALFVVGEWLGYNGFQLAKPLAMAFTVLCLPVSWQVVRQVRPQGVAALFAPMFLALNAQVAIWSGSGLENSLFFLLILLGIRDTTVDARTGRVPRSAGWFLLLAFTRPDGLLYAAIGGFWYLVALRRAGHSLRGVAWWLGLFWIPYGLHELWRLWYFAWPLPNTYYAKLVARDPEPLAWNRRGWGQLREFAGRLWQGYYLPVYLAGLHGLSGRGARWGFGIAGVLALSLLWPGPQALQETWFWPELPEPPTVLTGARVFGLYAAGALYPVLARGRPGADVLGLSWHLVVAPLAFGIYANGDWMGGYRWMSLAMPAASVLFAVGVGEWADALEARIGGRPTWDVVGWLAAALLVLGQLPPNFSQDMDHLTYNRNETPVMVLRRADYTKRIARRLFYEDVVVNLEMDQGAHLYWRPEYVEVDMAGLVDIAMAHHRYKHDPFIAQYVFDEMEPTFAHVHGQWAKGTRLKEYDAWAEMFELPPYDDAELGPHSGVWARRSLLLPRRWQGTVDRHVVWPDGLELLGAEVANREWGAGRYAYLEVALDSRPRTADEAPSVVAFVHREGRLRSWSLPLGQGLIPIEDWREDEVFVGRWALRLPDDLPLGSYDLGFVALGADGAVLPADRSDPDAAPVLAAGEVVFPGVIEVVDGERVEPLAEQGLEEAVRLARAGACEAAEDRWIRAKRQVPYLYGWHDANQPVIASPLADCWAHRAAQADPDSAPELLARAHRWDPHSAVLAEVGAPIGDRLWRRGLQARRDGDHEVALSSFTRLLRFQPWRSWARRYNEEARDEVLGIER